MSLVRIPTLLVTGPVGVGKTTVAFEILEVLEERDVPHVYFDADSLTYFHPKPKDDRFGDQFALVALGFLFPRLRQQGIDRLILSRVVEDRALLRDYERAIPGLDITVVRLTAPLETIQARIRKREIGAGLEWHLSRAAELDNHWRRNPVEDILVDTTDRSVRSIADEILSSIGWI